MKKFAQHRYVDCEDPANHHKKQHWKIGPVVGIVEVIGALNYFLFSFEEIVKKEGYAAALKRFCDAKRYARKILKGR